MKRPTLDYLALPRTGLRYAIAALASARRRQKQFHPGQEPPTAPGEDPVSHYSGPPEEVVPGGPPESPIGLAGALEDDIRPIPEKKRDDGNSP
jgi:hypothetical protein